MPTERGFGMFRFCIALYKSKLSHPRFSARLLGSTKSLTSRSICFPSSKPSLQAHQLPPKAPKPHARTATKPLPGASASGTGCGTAAVHAERTERPVQRISAVGAVAAQVMVVVGDVVVDVVGDVVVEGPSKV